MGTTIATASTTGDLDINLGTLQANLIGNTIQTTSDTIRNIRYNW